MDSGAAWDEFLGLCALSDEDFERHGDRAAELVHLLNDRGEPEVVDWAIPLLTDPDEHRRQGAAWVLGQHGFQRGRPYGAQIMPALAAAARIERDELTREFLVTAMGHAEDPSWAEELMSYANDPYPPIRQTVAASLRGLYGYGELPPRAVDTLVPLMSDNDPHVRDWATTAIASQTELDTAEIRKLLRALLDDFEDDSDTAGEAALGLALRHDPAVFEHLQRWLDAPPDDVGALTVEAAGELGDARLLPQLLRLRDVGWAGPGGFLTAAIAQLEQPETA